MERDTERMDEQNQLMYIYSTQIKSLRERVEKESAEVDVLEKTIEEGLKMMKGNIDE